MISIFGNSCLLLLFVIWQVFISGDSSYLSYDDRYKPVRKFSGRGVEGGLYQPGIQSLEECIEVCVADPGGPCLGVDYDSLRDACYFHGPQSECNPHWISNKHITHYRLTKICQQGSSLEEFNFGQQADNFHVDLEYKRQRGNKFNGIVNSDRIVNEDSDFGLGLLPENGHQQLAQSSLPSYLYESKQYGSDYGIKKFNRFYDGDSTLSKLSVKDSLRTDQISEDNELLVEPISFSSNLDRFVPTSSAHGRLKSKLYDRLLEDKLPTTSQEGLPTGYASVTRGSRLSGGYRFLIGTTERQCLDACLMTSRCLAVDYDTSERACYVHSTTSYCSGLFTANNVNHYQRIPCLYGSVNRVVEVQYNYLVSGGDDDCVGCSLDECLEGCLDNSDCQGVDYDTSQQRCYLHSADTLCSAFQPTNSVVHIGLKSCSGVTDQSLSYLGFNSWFSRIRYMGPTKLPRGWLAYPGFRVYGGVVIAFNVSGDECAALCALHDSCYSFDYNTRDGSCWVETSERLKCGGLIPTNDVYHAKKPKACIYASGTHHPYPYPIAVAI